MLTGLDLIPIPGLDAKRPSLTDSAADSHRQFRSPRQASKVYATGRYAAKQHHQFAVKFTISDPTTANADAITNLTFVVKMVDRPKVDPKTEELHQYNKRRQIYTGLKYQPMRIQFYDDGHGRALQMWQDYSAYYFGDFRPNKNQSYKTAVIESTNFDTDGTGFGLVSPKGGSGASGGGQYYLRDITIYHLYDAEAVDSYTLTNPRISLFEPDDLNYEESAVSVISMTIVYENLQYDFQSTTALQQDDQIFAEGRPFDGDVMRVDEAGIPGQFTSSIMNTLLEDRQKKRIGARDLTDPPGVVKTDDPWFRYKCETASGGIGLFGAYIFGPGPKEVALSMLPIGPGPKDTVLAAEFSSTTPKRAGIQEPQWTPESEFSSTEPKRAGLQEAQWSPETQASNYLWTMGLDNFPLAAALNMGLVGNPLALTDLSMAGAANMGRRGMDGAAYDVAFANASEGSTGYGDTIPEVVTGMLASNAITGNSSTRTSSGLTLSPESYGVMNSRQTGTAQYGYNNNSAPDGSSWGYTGPAGYQGPYGDYNDGPYAADRPAGLSGRAGIVPEPVADYNDNPTSLPDYN